MEQQTRNGLIAVGATILLVGTSIFIYRRFNPVIKNGNVENFNNLLTNLGGEIKPDKNMIASVPFNDKKNIAQFYNNGRVIIFEGAKIVLRGNYIDGGKTITVDGAPEKQVSSSSVYENINNLITK